MVAAPRSRNGASFALPQAVRDRRYLALVAAERFRLPVLSPRALLRELRAETI